MQSAYCQWGDTISHSLPIMLYSCVHITVGIWIVNINTNMGTTELRLDVIASNCTTIGLPKQDWLGYKSLGQTPGFPLYYRSRRDWTGIFRGALADGTIVPEGRYRFVVSALRIFGDRAKKEDWDVVETVPFILEYTDNV